MPSANSSFGTKPYGVKLSIKDAKVEPWKQSIQFRFKKNGTGASKDNDSDHVHEGDPNWYVYWQQVAKQFGFGPECPTMRYVEDLRNADGEKKQGIYQHNGDTAGNWTEEILVGRWHEEGVEHTIVTFVTTIHHENGHRQSLQEDSLHGGWEKPIKYVWTNDVDVDEQLSNRDYSSAIGEWKRSSGHT